VEQSREQAVRAYQAGVVGLALLVLTLIWLLAPVQFDPALLALAAGLCALVAIGDRTELTFRFGGEAFAATSATVPLLVSALFLPPLVAGGVGLVSYLVVELRRGQVLHALWGASGSALGLVAASCATRALVGGAPSPQLALVAGLLAALVFETVYTGSGLVMLEMRRRGAAREFLPDARPVIAFDVVLGTIGVIVVAPFGGHPLALLGVLVAFQVVAHAVLGTLEREQVHRTRASMLEDTFSRYVPSAVVQQLIDSAEDVELGGETRDVTVLFCDIRDFTSWAERNEPAAVLADLNELLGVLAQCVFETEGTLDKFTGDGLMAFWGAPVAQPDHVDRAVRAALRFEAVLRELNERRAASGERPFRIGVGIHSGDAIVGNVGHEDRHDYTAIGDTVNVAARLEAASKQLGAPIVVSREAHAQLSDALGEQARAAGEISVKGRATVLEVFVLGETHGEDAAAA
jgi:class 3 adenylate cyclase